MGNLRMKADQISYKGGEKPMTVEQAIKNAGNAGLAHTADIAPEFSTEAAYSAGDMVYYNDSLYVFIADHVAGVWSSEDTQAVTISSELATLKSGLITPSSGYAKLGSGAIDSDNPVVVSLGNNNISDYDVLYFCVSYHDSGVAAYGGLAIPTILVRWLYSADVGIRFMARSDTYNDTVAVAVVLNTNNNTIRFDPSAQPPGRYYVVYGVKWRTSN